MPKKAYMPRKSTQIYPPTKPLDMKPLPRKMELKTLKELEDVFFMTQDVKVIWVDPKRLKASAINDIKIRKKANEQYEKMMAERKIPKDKITGYTWAIFQNTVQIDYIKEKFNITEDDLK